MLEQTRQAATIFSRVADDWVGHLVTGNVFLAFPEIGIELPLSEAYLGIEFSELLPWPLTWAAVLTWRMTQIRCRATAAAARAEPSATGSPSRPRRRSGCRHRLSSAPKPYLKANQLQGRGPVRCGP